MQHIIEMDGETIMFVNGDIFKAVNAWTGEPIVRTKQSHPYSYEPFTVWGKKVENGNGVYSDRLYQWDYAKYNKCCEEIWGNQGQYFDSRSPQSIENFLKLYLGKDNINLTWIVEDCNSSNGFQSVADGFSHMSQGRGKTFWDQAVSVQEFLNGHEMYDVILEWEEAYPEKIYTPITDREALLEFGKGGSVWSRSNSGNAQGYKEITDPEYFMQKCYHHCTVYKRGGETQ